MLSLSHVSVGYGPIRAVERVSLEVGRGEIVLLAGSNGAGKTTLLRTIAGLMAPREGEVVFKGRRIDGWPAYRVASVGLRYVPEGRRVWPTLSVGEHLQLAWHPLDGARRRLVRDRILSLFPRLQERWTQRAGSLSGGEQQMLAIARGLAADPELLMIDEMSLGLAPAIVRQLFDTLRRINQEGVTLLVVEQALVQALNVASRGYVLETGQLVVAGTAADLRDNGRVRRAYLSV